MRKKAPFNLSVDPELARAIRGFTSAHPRKGRRNVSELTESLWISFLRRKGAKLPVLFKNV